jgi:hypothetical protein
VGLAILAGFATARWLDPYETDGRARQFETHVQLGLPPCSFRILTGMPCPACGLTTSVSLLAHRDLPNSLRANAVGTLLAVLGLLAVPWAWISAWRGKLIFVRSLEWTLFRLAVVILVLLLVRWLFVVFR